MDNLNEIITQINSKLNKIGEKLFSKNKLKIKKSPLELINKQEQSIKNIGNKINTNNEKIIQREGIKKYLEPDELKVKIKSMLSDNFISKIYL